MSKSDEPTRRRFLGCLGTAMLAPAIARAETPPPRGHGLLKPPVPVPDVGLVCDDGRRTTLPALVAGHVTAVQLMFTSCTVTCPIQGAIFAQAQRLLPEAASRGVQWLSVSVDPEHDTPAALKDWLRRFKRRPGWIAAASAAADVERLRDFAGRGQNPSDNHSTQVQIVGRQGAVLFRTGALPAAQEVAALLRRFAAI